MNLFRISFKNDLSQEACFIQCWEGDQVCKLRFFFLLSSFQGQHIQMSTNIYIATSNENERISLILSICRFRRQRQAIGRARLSVVVIHLVHEWEKHILRSVMHTVILIDRTQFYFAFVFRLCKTILFVYCNERTIYIYLYLYICFCK